MPQYICYDSVGCDSSFLIFLHVNVKGQVKKKCSVLARRKV